MKFSLRKFFCAGLVSAIMAFAAGSASAVPYSIYQGGFSGGGTLNGFFIGEDTDNSNTITLEELSAFGLSFTGDSFVSNIFHSLSDLEWFSYTLGSSSIDVDGLIQSGATAQGTPGAVSFYLGGMAAAWMFDDILALGYAQDFESELFSYTTEAINVAVSEPAPWMLIAGGLLAFGLRRRWMN